MGLAPYGKRDGTGWATWPKSWDKWGPRWGLAPPHTFSSLTGLCLPLTSNFVVATWGLAGGILPWQGTGWWQPSPGPPPLPAGSCSRGKLEGEKSPGGMKWPSPKCACCIGVPMGGLRAELKRRCSTARPERLRVPLTG